MHANLLMVWMILCALKRPFKEDLDMELPLPNCQVLIPGLSQEDAEEKMMARMRGEPDKGGLRSRASAGGAARTAKFR